MLRCLLNYPPEFLHKLEENYLSSSKNEEHKRARKKVCFEIRRFFSLPFAPLIKSPEGEVTLFGSEWKIALSHKEEFAALVLSRDYEALGIDLEFFDNDVDWRSFHGRFFNREDWFLAHQISSYKKISFNQALTLLFSAKEAMLKACHLKRDALDIIFYFSTSPMESQNVLRLISSIDLGHFILDIKWDFSMIGPPPYVLSLCVIENNRPLSAKSLFEEEQLFISLLP